MKKIIIIILIITYVNAIENNIKKENFEISYSLEREIKTYKIIKDTILNYDNTLELVKKAYSKPLNNDFESLREFEKNIKEK